MNIIITIIVGIAVFNLLMLTWSLIELWRSRFINDSWLMSDQVLMPSSGPARATVILIHGFIDSPLGVKPLAKKLHEEGNRVVVPVIPFQASKNWAFSRGRFKSTDYIQWLEDVIQNQSNEGHERPFLVGFSMGGTLATIVTVQDQVEGTVLLAPYYGLIFGTRLCGVLAKWLRWIIPVVPSILGRPINDPEGRRLYRPGSRLINVGAFYQLELLRRKAMASVAHIQTPVAVFAAPKDRVAACKVVETLWRNHPRVAWHIQPQANHVLCYDYDAEVLLKESVRFFKTI